MKLFLAQEKSSMTDFWWVFFSSEFVIECWEKLSFEQIYWRNTVLVLKGLDKLLLEVLLEAAAVSRGLWVKLWHRSSVRPPSLPLNLNLNLPPLKLNLLLLLPTLNLYFGSFRYTLLNHKMFPLKFKLYNLELYSDSLIENSTIRIRNFCWW